MAKLNLQSYVCANDVLGSIEFVPRGWPNRVRPPRADDWEESASAFLFDSCPPDFRRYPVLRRHPVVLASFATRFLQSQVAAVSDGLSEVRVNLRGVVDPEVIEAAVGAWQSEQSALERRLREVGLVEEALRGHLFVPKL